MTALAHKSVDHVRLEAQPFEAEFLEGPCFHLTIPPALSAEIAAREFTDAAAKARTNGARLVSARLPAARADMIVASEQAGFRRIETLITFERAISDGEALASDHRVRLVRSEDVAACVEIGGSSFQTDRFHADTRIAKSAADQLKARWVANDLAGRADAAFVVLSDGRPVGFNLCLKRNSMAIIDLIAVARLQRGQGLGAALVAASLSHYAKSARAMQVGTQASNVASIALYRRFGFSPVAEAVTLHWMP